MKKLNCTAITGKGALKNDVRNAVVGLVAGQADTLADLGYDWCADKKAYVMPIADISGNIIYATLTLTVGTTHPSNKAEKKSKPKAKTEAEPIEIGD